MNLSKEGILLGGGVIFSTYSVGGDASSVLEDTFVDFSRFIKPSLISISELKIGKRNSVFNFSNIRISATSAQDALRQVWDLYSKEYLDYLKTTGDRTYAGKITLYGWELLYFGQEDLPKWRKVVTDRFHYKKEEDIAKQVSHFQHTCKQNLNQIPNPRNLQPLHTLIRLCTVSLSTEQRVKGLGLEILDTDFGDYKCKRDVGNMDYFVNELSGLWSLYLKTCIKGSPNKPYWTSK